MISDLEGIAAADLISEDTSRPSNLSSSSEAICANCQLPLQGRWCSACGQKASDTHRSVRHLIADAFEGLTHADSRLWRTLYRLVRAPGGLTKDYINGKRVPQIPPFRMFLVVVLLVFFAGSISELGPKHVDLELVAEIKDSSTKTKTATSKLVIEGDSAFAVWLNTHVQKGLAHPEAVVRGMEHWGHQFAILSLLVAAPLLALVYVFQRQVRFYDHLIFSMHSLSFQGLLMSLSTLVGGWLSWGDSLLILAPAHLFAHMRGFYGGSAVGILARMGFIFVGSVVGFTILFVALLLIGVAGVH